MRMHRPVWFDIDGTLLHTRVGHEAFRLALRDVFGWEESMADVRFAGNTDLRVLMDLSERHAGSVRAGLERKGAFFSSMAAHLDRGLVRDKPETVPGASELIHAMADHEEVGLYLLTGNARDCAFLKLRHAELAGPFDDGAFGDEHEDRNVLARRSRDRLALLHRYRPLHAGWVIGDTPRDVRAARAIGARAIGVATRAYTPDQLREAGADRVVEHLEDVLGLMDVVLGP